MSCNDFEGFRHEYSDRCAICAKTAEQTAHGHLCIDHDPFIGRWAVRGLLCSSHNYKIAYPDFAESAAGIAYLAQSWYLRRCAALGLSVEYAAEPATGAIVLDTFNRRWQRQSAGWWKPLHGTRSGRKTWRELNQRFGPWNLHVESRV